MDVENRKRKKELVSQGSQDTRVNKQNTGRAGETRGHTHTCEVLVLSKCPGRVRSEVGREQRRPWESRSTVNVGAEIYLHVRITGRSFINSKN